MNKDPNKVRGRGMVFIAAHVRPDLRAELEAWAKEEDRTLSKLVTRLISADLEESGYYPPDEREDEPQRKDWPEISLAPPVKITIL